MALFTCLENVVGITDSDCPCIVQGLSQEERDNLAITKSGLLTDNLEGGIHLKVLKEIDACKNLAQIMLNARDNAIQKTGDDLVLALNQKFFKNRNAYTGNVGNPTISVPLIMAKRWGGIRFKPHAISDGIITITGGQFAFTATTTVTAKIFRSYCQSDESEEVGSFDIDAQNGVRADFTLATPIKLPLRYKNRAVEYNIVFDKSLYGGALPMNNKVSCGCGNADKPLHEYVSVNGVEFDNSNLMTNRSLDDYAHGFILDIDIRCDNQTFVCREFDANEAVSITLAYAVLYKAGELGIEGVMKSPDVNRFTMMNREYLWGKRNHFRAEYETRIKYLQADGVVDLSSTDCFICKQDDLFYSGIFS